MMRFGVALLASVGLASCSTVPGTNTVRFDPVGYCNEQPLICAAIGAAVIGGAVAIAAAHSDNGSSAAPISLPSDGRLKTDLRLVSATPDGIRLYAFRYKGDSRTFVGVIAQEIMADTRFARAVQIDARGCYTVDYRALGLKVLGAEAMREAGLRAEQAL